MFQWTDEILDNLERWTSYRWEWRIIQRMLDRNHGILLEEKELKYVLKIWNNCNSRSEFIRIMDQYLDNIVG